MQRMTFVPALLRLPTPAASSFRGALGVFGAGFGVGCMEAPQARERGGEIKNRKAGAHSQVEAEAGKCQLGWSGSVASMGVQGSKGFSLLKEVFWREIRPRSADSLRTEQF